MLDSLDAWMVRVWLRTVVCDITADSLATAIVGPCENLYRHRVKQASERRPLIAVCWSASASGYIRPECWASVTPWLSNENPAVGG